jgi:hypothetical protein
MAERPVLPKKPGNAGGGKGPWFKDNAGRSDGEEIGVSLPTPESVWKLQAALHAKAKGEPAYRFYSLYDKIRRDDVMLYAWKRCRANGGTAGVDGQSFEQIEAEGLERWLAELREEVWKRTYRPQAVRRVWIPKADGKQRPLGIPTIRDRVVQMAAVIVLEPIFEADLAERSSMAIGLGVARLPLLGAGKSNFGPISVVCGVVRQSKAVRGDGQSRCSGDPTSSQKTFSV